MVHATSNFVLEFTQGLACRAESLLGHGFAFRVTLRVPSGCRVLGVRV